MAASLYRRNLPTFGVTGWLGLACVLALALPGCLGPLLLPLDPYGLGAERLAAPRLAGAGGPLLGTDDLGRDLLARLVYGARSSLGIGIAVVAVAALAGTALGLFAGVYGGRLDALIMRLMDAVMTLPSILLAIVIVAALGPGLPNAMLAVTVVAVPRFTRLVRAVAALEMRKQYVQAARAAGASRFRILWSEVLPNCTGPVIAQAALGFSDAILEIAALGFLGLGATPPLAEWGAMLADARPFIESAPYMMVLPGVCILLAVLGFNLLGDALQDMLDPGTKVLR
ncbi:ABC transporter permease [Noviherbaspirillum sp.]|uniref:ABC transporter permease n=1 Tax=Noviherbaspirillum sp. TaxID=1926288 RepID=UPI002D518CBD|nr:ABC transporter permease [Noviherbaspirillum sp.]HZW21737.1 ABC transporter permease [Noviherbaspirillum sp.]